MPRLGVTVALSFAVAAHGQVPASNDTSDGNNNTGVGTAALGGPAASNSGGANTAVGWSALQSNTTGTQNTAVGLNALLFNTTGEDNTASGADAMLDNKTGSNNTASGAGALTGNTTGSFNTADGVDALELNVGGSFNTASGYQALFNNTVNYNTGFGYAALFSNTTGLSNTAVGVQALLDNVTGDQNTATGYLTLVSSTGSNNTGFGYEALRSLKSGSSNIALGSLAGYNITTGSNDIDIGNTGDAAESGVIRIGTSGTQTAAYIAGIVGTKITGSEVVITASGQLGVKASSERYKTDIAPIGGASGKLDELRPVSFHLKADPKGDVQYGLIAEEVAKVYPELVIRDESGRIDGVRYDELAPMLLNELQKQAAEIRDLKQQVAKVNDLQLRLNEVVLELRPKEAATARR
jgi:hypothetical protein